jgi:hypothetical protein
MRTSASRHLVSTRIGTGPADLQVAGPVEILKPNGFHRFFYQFLGTEISRFCLFLSISAALKMQKYVFERLQLTNV